MDSTAASPDARSEVTDLGLAHVRILTKLLPGHRLHEERAGERPLEGELQVILDYRGANALVDAAAEVGDAGDEVGIALGK